MFVVDINSTGAEIWIFVIDARLSNLEEDSKENPYLDPFLVIVFPIAIVIGAESVVVWFETAKC